MHHAYLFVGSRGTGKTSLAKILARSLNCVQRADRHALRRVRSLPGDRRRLLARRDRDGCRLEPLDRGRPRPARARGVRAGRGPLQGLHPRRSPHAHPGGLERLPEDPRGAAAEHGLRALHDRGAQGDGDHRRSLSALRLPAPLARADRHRRSAELPARSRSRSTTPRSRRSREAPPGVSAMPSAPSTSSSPTSANESRRTTSWPSSASPTPS